MDLDLAPSWPPPGRWFLGLIIGALIAASIPVLGLTVAGIAEIPPILVGLGIASVLVFLQVVGRWTGSRKPRILRLTDAELTAVMKLIDQSAQSREKFLARQAQDYLVLHRRIAKRDAASAVGKLLRRDYPDLADKFGYLD